MNGNARVRKIVRNCVPCKILRGKLSVQKMCDLPPDRTKPAPPFTYCGVDLFAPFVVKEGRKELKRYGSVFTCFGSRAIHIEMTSGLDADSFILALRRFVGRRGPVRSIRSDNGTADNEMKEEIKNGSCKDKGFLDN